MCLSYRELLAISVISGSLCEVRCKRTDMDFPSRPLCRPLLHDKGADA